MPRGREHFSAFSALSFALLVLCAACTPVDTQRPETRRSALSASEQVLPGGLPISGIVGDVDTDGRFIVAGAAGDNLGAGAVLVWHNPGAGFGSFAAGPIRSATAAPNEGFGASVAVADGVMVVGVPDTGGTGGRLEFYQLDSASGGSATLLPAPSATRAEIGFSVDIGGGYAIAGGADEARVYAPDLGVQAGWSEVQVLTDPTGQPSDSFGRAVATDGTTFAVAAPFSNMGVGRVLVFDRVQGWAQVGRPLTEGSVDQFGMSVAVHGPLLAVGSNGEVYVFERVGNTYQRIAALTMSGIGGLGFGISLDLEGDTVVAGLPIAQDAMTGIFGGKIGVFSRDLGGPDNFGLDQQIISAFSVDGQQLGSTVALGGSYIVSGAGGGDQVGPGLGSVHLFVTDLPPAPMMAPTAVDDRVVVDEDAMVTIDVLANDVYSAAAPGPLVTVVEPSEGNALQNGLRVSFTPGPDFNGDVSFSYQLTDVNGSSEATIAVTVLPVNDAPAFVDPTPATITALVGSAVEFVVAATDVDGDSVTLSMNEGPGEAAFDAASGTLTWDTAGTQPDVVGFQFEASDGMQVALALVAVTLLAPEDPCEGVVCDDGQICFAGSCFDACEDSSACEPTASCFNDRCAQDACDGVECAGESVCFGGGCFEPCTRNEDCRSEQDCFAGRCASNPCAGVTCAVEAVCFGGACFQPCVENESCPQQESCFDGHCASSPCDQVQCRVEDECVSGTCFPGCVTTDDCGDGTVCRDGLCVLDACEGVVCGDDSACVDGGCETRSTGCSCALAPGGSNDALLWVAVIAFCAVLRRRVG